MDIGTQSVETADLRQESSEIITRAANNYGFLTRAETDIMTLAGGQYARVRCVIRCGTQRDIREVRDVRTYISCIEAQGDYVRDVSIIPEDMVKLGLRAKGL